MYKRVAVLTVLMLWLFIPAQTNGADTESFTITPDSNPHNDMFMSDPTYTEETKHYYLIRSYLEHLEETGGGELLLEKGTYKVSNVLFVPSNVRIELQDGATIVKGIKTGTPELDADKSIFQFVRPSLGKEKAVYGKYDGEKNISIIGVGTATIDLNYEEDALAIIAGHNQNVKIKNIHFVNMYSGHFIEIDGNKNAVIANNKFMYSKPSSSEIKEAINLDTPDNLTNGWSSEWSKFDKTPNFNVIIENNLFYDLDRAIGTHKYSEGKYHEGIKIRNNRIQKMRQDAIRVMNWSNAIIENNVIKDVEPGENNANRGIFASGAINPTFRNNLFENMPRPIQFIAWKNSNSGSEYDITYNELSEENKGALKTNTITDYDEDFIRINPEINKHEDEHTEFISIKTVNPYLPANSKTTSAKLMRNDLLTLLYCPKGTFNLSAFHSKILLIQIRNHWNADYEEFCINTQ